MQFGHLGIALAIASRGTVERRGIPARAVLDDRARHLLADPRLRRAHAGAARQVSAAAVSRRRRPGPLPALLLVASSGALLRIPLPLLVLASVGIVLADRKSTRLNSSHLVI